MSDKLTGQSAVRIRHIALTLHNLTCDLTVMKQSLDDALAKWAKLLGPLPSQAASCSCCWACCEQSCVGPCAIQWLMQPFQEPLHKALCLNLQCFDGKSLLFFLSFFLSSSSNIPLPWLWRLMDCIRMGFVCAISFSAVRYFVCNRFTAVWHDACNKKN